MTLINYRLPAALAPTRCAWGRSRSDMLSASPRSRVETLVQQGRPLWQASMTWQSITGVREAQLRYILDGLEGYRGSIQLWDASALGNSAAAANYWSNAGINYAWTWYGLSTFWQTADTYTANGTAGAYTVTISGLTPNAPVVIQGGYVQVGRRLYLADNGYTADAGGVCVVGLTTPLLATVVAGTARLTSAGVEMRLVKQDWSSSRDAQGQSSTVSCDFLETAVDFA